MGKIIESIRDLNVNAFFRLHDFLGSHRDVYLKLEGLNPAGSIKFKPARYMIQDLEERRVIQPGRNKIVESSSGNLGVALAQVCKVKGYPFTYTPTPMPTLRIWRISTTTAARSSWSRNVTPTAASC